MVRADKHPLRPPVLPPLCEPLPPHKVGGGGFLHLCTLSSVVVHANIMQKNRGKKMGGGTFACIHTPASAVVCLICHQWSMLLSSAQRSLMKCRAGTTTGACAGDSLQCLLG